MSFYYVTIGLLMGLARGYHMLCSIPGRENSRNYIVISSREFGEEFCESLYWPVIAPLK